MVYQNEQKFILKKFGGDGSPKIFFFVFLGGPSKNFFLGGGGQKKNYLFFWRGELHPMAQTDIQTSRQTHTLTWQLYE